MNIYLILGVILIIILLLVSWYLWNSYRKKKNLLFSGSYEGVLYNEGTFLSGLVRSLIGMKKEGIDNSSISPKELDLFENGFRDAKKRDNLTLRQEKGSSEDINFKETSSKETEKGVQDSEKRTQESRKKLDLEIKKDKELLKKIEDKHKRESNLINNEATTSGRLEGKAGGRVTRPISAKDYLEKIKGSDLYLILMSLKKEEHNFILKKILEMNFESKRDFVSSLMKEIVNLLNEAYKELKVRTSALRKKGRQTGGID